MFSTVVGLRVAIILYSYQEVEHGTTKPNRAEDSHGQLQAGNVAVVTIQNAPLSLSFILSDLFSVRRSDDQLLLRPPPS